MLQPLVEPVPCTCDSAGSIDPTGTAVLRRKFRRQVTSRVERFRAQVCSAILNKDVLGLDGKSYMSVHPAAVCCAAFAYCLDSASQSFAGGWGSIFIQKAWDSGIAAIGVEVPEHLNRVEQYHLLFQQEVAGIVAALNQQLNRAINEIILSKVTTVSACHTVREVIKKISPRFDALVNTMVVKVHNLARIEALRVSGVEFFRVKAERIPATVVSDARKKLRIPRRTKYVEVITAGDDKVCPRCEMLEGEIFTYGEARLLLPLHVNCLPGDSFVSPIGRVAAVSKRAYEGDLIVIRTAAGNVLKATPNHPVLTDRGWVGIQFLNKGSRVVRYCGGNLVFSGAGHDYKHVPTRIENIAETFTKFGSLVSVPLDPMDFHGDGTDGYVDIVNANSFLEGNWFNVSLGKQIRKESVQRRNFALAALQSSSALDLLFQTTLSASNCIVRGFSEVGSFFRSKFTPIPLQVSVVGSSVGRGDLGLSLLGGHVAPAGGSDFRGGSKSDPRGSEVSFNMVASQTETFDEVRNRLPFTVAFDEVVELERIKYCGHVYNLETSVECYLASNIVTHNCRCAFVGHYLRALDAFEESAHPRAGIGQHTGGQFTSKGGKPSAGSPVPTRAFGSKNARLQQALAAHHQQEEVINHYGMKLVRLKKAAGKAFNGEQIETKVKLSKLETDAVGESIALSYLRSIGFIHARTANTEGNNFPIDIFADHRAIELKSGQVSNTKAAQQFRVTIGQPGKAETALLKTMSPEEKYKHNAAKLNAAIKRKVDIAKNYGMRPVTMTVLFNPDTKHADVYVLEGYHKRLGWNSKELISGYVGSFYYK